MSAPQLYRGITLLSVGAYNEEEGFNPDSPFQIRRLKYVSHQGFVEVVKSDGGTTVVLLEEFDPSQQLMETPPEDVELHDGATFIVIPPSHVIRTKYIVEKYQRTLSKGCDRDLTPSAVEILKNAGHLDAKPVYDKEFGSKYGLPKKIDGAAISEHCGVIVHYRHTMDEGGAIQLLETLDFIESMKEKSNTNVSIFAGRQIIGVLAGTREVFDAKNKARMDRMLNATNCHKLILTQQSSPTGNLREPQARHELPHDMSRNKGTKGNNANGTTATALPPGTILALSRPANLKSFTRGTCAMPTNPRLGNAIYCRIPF